MVSRGLVDADVLPVFPVVLVYGIAELLFGRRVILVGHADIPDYITVAHLRDKRVTRKLHAVIIRPDGHNLKLTGVAVEIDIEIVSVILAEPCKLTVLERYALDRSGKFITVRVEIQGSVTEIIYRVGFTVLVLHLLAAHAAYRTHTPGIDTAEGIAFVAVEYAVLVNAHLDKLLPARKHQAAAAVLFRVDVARGAYREQAGVEPGRAARDAFQGNQPTAVTQRDAFPVLAAADVHRLSLDPPFGLAAHFFGNRLQCLIAVHPLVIYDDEFRTVNLPDLPVGDIPHAGIDGTDHQRHMLPRRSCQREHRFGIAVRRLQYKETPDEALDAVQFQIVAPFAFTHLLRRVAFRQPVTLAHEVRVVVHIDGYMGMVREGEGQHVVTLHLLPLGRAVVSGDVRPPVSFPVVYRNHVRLSFKCRLNVFLIRQMTGTGSRNFTLNLPACTPSLHR